MGVFTETVRALTPQFRADTVGPLPLTAAKIVEWMGGKPSVTGVAVTPEKSLRLATVYICVRVIAEDVAKLPLITYRRLPRGKDRATTHRLYRLLHDAPNPHMTAMQFRETMQGHLLTWGNAYANIERDGNGFIRYLWPLRPDRMETPVLAQDGRLLYTYRLKSGEPVPLTQDEVMHLRGLSGDGVMGYSPIQLHRETIGWAFATQEYGARFYGNDSRPGGVLQSAKPLSKEAAERLRANWSAAHQGLSNSHRVAVLEDGITWQTIGIPPEDAQYIETMTMQVQEIAARIFRIPPHKVGELSRATFSNVEEQSISYVTDTLTPWLVRWEQQMNKDLLTPAEQKEYFVEHLVDALLRGKTLERQQALQVQRQNGVINADDWNEIENRNPLPDGMGGYYLVPANMWVLTPDGPKAVDQATAPEPEQPPAPDNDADGEDDSDSGQGRGQRSIAVEARCPSCNRLVGRNITDGDFDCPRCKRAFAVRAGVLTEPQPVV